MVMAVLGARAKEVVIHNGARDRQRGAEGCNVGADRGCGDDERLQMDTLPT